MNSNNAFFLRSKQSLLKSFRPSCDAEYAFRSIIAKDKNILKNKYFKEKANV